MPVWKVLIIGALACVCMGLGMATVVIGVDQEGNQRWLWLGGLLTATLCVGGATSLFLRYAGRSLDVNPGKSQN